jgi:hypothetical protein
MKLHSIKILNSVNNEKILAREYKKKSLYSFKFFCAPLSDMKPSKIERDDANA